MGGRLLLRICKIIFKKRASDWERAYLRTKMGMEINKILSFIFWIFIQINMVVGKRFVRYSKRYCYNRNELECTYDVWVHHIYVSCRVKKN